MRSLVILLLLYCVNSFAAKSIAPLSIEDFGTPWSEGAEHCKGASVPALEVRRIDPSTFVLREGLCSTDEAPFMYLIVGQQRALLIDTGDVADPEKMPLAETVDQVMANVGEASLPLLVVHTHRHSDHRRGDPQFIGRSNSTVIGYTLEDIKKFYGFKDWPNDDATIDLGNRVVDVIPTPGHNETHVVFFDRDTSTLFTGDFLLPGRLFIDDREADVASARRVADFARTHTVALVLGGHVEIDRNGNTYEWSSTFHPNEHPLQLSVNDVVSFAEAVTHFNGVFTHYGPFIMQNQWFVPAFMD